MIITIRAKQFGYAVEARQGERVVHETSAATERAAKGIAQRWALTYAPRECRHDIAVIGNGPHRCVFCGETL